MPTTLTCFRIQKSSSSSLAAGLVAVKCLLSLLVLHSSVNVFEGISASQRDLEGHSVVQPVGSLLVVLGLQAAELPLAYFIAFST